MSVELLSLTACKINIQHNIQFNISLYIYVVRPFAKSVEDRCD